MEQLTIEKLAEVLQEPNRPLLRQVLRVPGPDRTTEILADALMCEAAGGLLTTDGTRRRTPGGVFFQLAKERTTPQERRRLFPYSGPPRTPGPTPQTPATLQAPAPPQVLTWGEVSTIGQTLATTPAGEAKTMKLTLIGRPGKVDVRGQAVLFRMQGKPPATVPRGLPPLPDTPPLTWNVMVALRQWTRVKDSLESHPDDALIIEGYPLQQGSELVLVAQSCTSVALQREKKQAQQQQTQAETPA